MRSHAHRVTTRERPAARPIGPLRQSSRGLPSDTLPPGFQTAPARRLSPITTCGRAVHLEIRAFFGDPGHRLVAGSRPNWPRVGSNPGLVGWRRAKFGGGGGKAGEGRAGRAALVAAWKVSGWCVQSFTGCGGLDGSPRAGAACDCGRGVGGGAARGVARSFRAFRVGAAGCWSLGWRAAISRRTVWRLR
jgi:hypothetical protein